MNKRQKQKWNWAATCYVYTGGFASYLTAYDTEQVWDGTAAGHERLMKRLIEQLEGQRDRLGLSFRLHQPTAVKYCRWAESLPEVIEIE